MFDEEADEALVGVERGAVNTERDFLGVVAVLVTKIEPARLGEIDLVGGDGELTADHAPDLDVDLWSVEGGFVRHFDEVDAGTLQNVARHLLGLLPYVRFVDELLAELRGVVSGEPHHVSIDSEKPEIVQIHFVDGIELGLELLWRHVKMGVVHLQRAHTHETKELAALLVAMTGAVLRESQWQIAITPRQRRKHLMMMRAVHGL